MKKTLAFLIILIGFTLSAQHPGNDSNTNLKKIKVSGKILDNETKEPLEYATISFLNKKYSSY